MVATAGRWVFVWVGLLLLLLLAGLHWVSMPKPVPGASVVRQAQVQVIGQPQLGLKPVALPHVMDDETPQWQQQLAYRLAWPEALRYSQPGEGRYALLLPRVGTRFRVLLNEHEIANAGWYEPPEQTFNAAWLPYLVHLPPSLLMPQAQDNRLTVEVRGQLLERSGLWPVQVGDASALDRRHRVLEVWQVHGTWMMVMTSLLMAVMALFLWYLVREKLFALAALAALAHLVRLWLSVLVDPHMSYGPYFLLHRIAFTLYVGFLVLFLQELLGYRGRVGRWLVYALLVVGPFWNVAILLTQNYDLYRIWAGVMAVVGLTGLLTCMRQYAWGRLMQWDQRVVLLVAGFTLLTGVRDFLVVQLNFPGDADLRWTSVGGLVVMCSLGWVLLQRSTHSIREVRHLNATLSTQVAQREAELRTAFKQLHAVQHQRAVEGERRRLMRDMHDGLGSQLVQTLNMVRSHKAPMDPQPVALMISHALEELRMTLDSLEPMDGDLPTILGTLRQRVAPALGAAGIELDWQVEEVPPLEGLDSQGVMHLFRCVQEMFANVVKHAQASKVTVRTWMHHGCVHLSVQDDGVGLPPPALRREGGRGLDNIRVRAQKIGARLQMYDAQPGTGMELVFDTHGDFDAATTAWGSVGSG